MMTSAIMLLRALSKLTRSRIYTGNFFHLIYSASSLRKGKKKVQLATRVRFFFCYSDSSSLLFYPNQLIFIMYVYIFLLFLKLIFRFLKLSSIGIYLFCFSEERFADSEYSRVANSSFPETGRNVSYLRLFSVQHTQQNDGRWKTWELALAPGSYPMQIHEYLQVCITSIAG